MSQPVPAPRDWQYPAGTVAALLNSDLVTPATAKALARRLAARADKEPVVFGPELLAVLSAISGRLIPQSDRATPIDLAGAFVSRLAKGAGNGWRYADLPPDADMFDRGLRAIDTSAIDAFSAGFSSLTPAKQDDLLREVQFGRVSGPAWHGIKPDLFFQELLAALVDIYYADPVALDEIGYAGMADARGWQAVGIDARAEYEPIATPVRRP